MTICPEIMGYLEKKDTFNFKKGQPELERIVLFVLFAEKYQIILSIMTAEDTRQKP